METKCVGGKVAFSQQGMSEQYHMNHDGPFLTTNISCPSSRDALQSEASGRVPLLSREQTQAILMSRDRQPAIGEKVNVAYSDPNMATLRWAGKAYGLQSEKEYQTLLSDGKIRLECEAK